MKRSAAVIIASLTILVSQTTAEPISGIEFPFGPKSFVDRLVEFVPGPDVVAPWDDASRGLHPPDDTEVSETTSFALGQGGIVIYEFTDNVLVDQSTVENGNDLYIFEIGGAVEAFDVAISSDGVNFIDVGRVSGQPTAIDIGPFVEPSDTFRFVRLVDDNDGSSGTPFGGADIDAIGAIGSIVPEPSALCLAGMALVGLLLHRSKRSGH